MKNTKSKWIVTLTALAAFAAVQASAWETRNDTSYSGPNGGYISGSTSLSGTSRVAAKEQIRANAEQLAEFHRSYSVQVQEIVRDSRQVLVETLGSDLVAQMSDVEVIQTLERGN